VYRTGATSRHVVATAMTLHLPPSGMGCMLHRATSIDEPLQRAAGRVDVNECASAHAAQRGGVRFRFRVSGLGHVHAAPARVSGVRCRGRCASRTWTARTRDTDGRGITVPKSQAATAHCSARQHAAGVRGVDGAKSLMTRMAADAVPIHLSRRLFQRSIRISMPARVSAGPRTTRNASASESQ